MRLTMRNSGPAVAVAVSAALLAGYTADARANSADDFYRGKNVTIVVPVSAGGVYGTFSRILAKHMAKYMPGGANIVIEHKTGAGGIIGINYVYNVARKDGTVLLTPNTGIVSTAVLRPDRVKYDPGKFNYLGAWGEAAQSLTVLKSAPAKTLQEAKSKVDVLGTIGKGTTTYQVPFMLNNLLGTKFKLVTGYRGGSPIRLAMEKGEVDGWAGLYLGWKLRKPGWIKEGKVVHLLQVASKRLPDMSNVPTLIESAENDEQRQMFTFLTNFGITGFTFVAPPGVPEDRLAAMADAYAKTLKDPAFIKDAEARRYTIDPLSRQQVTKAVNDILSTPKAIKEKAMKAMGM